VCSGFEKRKVIFEAEDGLVVPEGEREFVAFMQGLSEQQIHDFGPACAMMWQQQTARSVRETEVEQENG
jgi:hypothetical protein